MENNIFFQKAEKKALKKPRKRNRRRRFFVPRYDSNLGRMLDQHHEDLGAFEDVSDWADLKGDGH